MGKKIMFGICTYNRKDILELSASSLNCINKLDEVDIHIFDDHSTEYDIEYLRLLYPYAKSIETTQVNCGADANGIRMLEYFVDKKYEWLFIADSDLIYYTDIISVINHCILKQGGNIGVVSLFNSFSYLASFNVDRMFCKKEHVGAAGVLMNADTAKLVLSTVSGKFAYDVQIMKVLKEKGYDILCTQNSYVQHIGIEGYNSLYYTFDWGKDFVLDSMLNAEILNTTINRLMSRIAEDNKKSTEDRVLEDIERKRISLKILFRIAQIKMKQRFSFKRIFPQS